MTNNVSKGPDGPDIKPSGESEVVDSIVIQRLKDGSIAINGPAGDPVLFLGLLEVAKSRLVVSMVMGELAQQQAMAKRLQTMATLVSPDGKPLA